MQGYFELAAVSRDAGVNDTVTVFPYEFSVRPRWTRHPPDPAQANEILTLRIELTPDATTFRVQHERSPTVR